MKQYLQPVEFDISIDEIKFQSIYWVGIPSCFGRDNPVFRLSCQFLKNLKKKSGFTAKTDKQFFY